MRVGLKKQWGLYATRPRGSDVTYLSPPSFQNYVIVILSKWKKRKALKNNGNTEHCQTKQELELTQTQYAVG
jgi:hypothetical protein